MHVWPGHCTLLRISGDEESSACRRTRCDRPLQQTPRSIRSLDGHCRLLGFFFFGVTKAVVPSAQFYLAALTHVSELKQLAALSPAALSAFIFSSAVCLPNNSFALTFTPSQWQSARSLYLTCVCAFLWHDVRKRLQVCRMLLLALEACVG